MGTATERPLFRALSVFLAGLQAGMAGACWMLAWLGISAVWQRRSFWTAENLMASAFYGDTAIHSGFTSYTISGLALYLVLYSLIGAVFALLLGVRFTRMRILLASVLFAMCWYYVSFHVIWRRVMPLVALLHAERPTALGHLIYGTFLGRYPAYLGGSPSSPGGPEVQVSSSVEPGADAAADQQAVKVEKTPPEEDSSV
jgi:hypothetical protein